MQPSARRTPVPDLRLPLIEQAEIDEVVACMESAWLGTGRVAQFERNFAAYQGMQPSQVAALYRSTVRQHGRGGSGGRQRGHYHSDDILRVVNAIIHVGLTPVLADVDPATQCIDPAAMEAEITPRTRAILPVHFAGRACEMGAIMAIAKNTI